ncbi:MAG: DUF885 domain-containing protein, partial [Gemmatimonadetes bacterium]|nr:DUF885 domain-containing protein [Gemmatimonadota bacterium]
RKTGNAGPKGPMPAGVGFIMTIAATLAALTADYWEFHLREHPATALELDDRRYSRELFKESIADHARRDREAAVFLQRLETLPADDLRDQDALTYHLLERELCDAREHFAFRSHVRPMLFPDGPEGRLAHAIEKTTLASRTDAEDYLARLESIPDLFVAWMERLRVGVDAGYRLPDVLLPRICRTAESYLSPPVHKSVWYKPMTASAAHAGAPFERARADLKTLIVEKIQPAYRRWIDDLRTLFTSRCRSSVAISEEPDGVEYYRFLVRNHTTTSLEPRQIYEIGRGETARIRSEMEHVAGQAGFDGSLADFRSQLSSDPRFVSKSAEELRERVEVLAKRIERRIPEFFGRLPRMTYGVESIPEALAEQLPPAYAQPSPASGRMAGVFWVTSLPKACPSYLHVPLTLHEAWPGHLMHIALVQEMTSLPAFRRHGLAGYSAYIEGWALYCERLGHEFGLLTEPAAQYGRLEMEMWRAVRLVVDTGIHAMGWSRAQAIAYMAEHLTLPAATIEAEVDRYIGWPGQALAYKLGEIKVRELRERATHQLGTRFDLRAFHDRVIDCGPVTLDLLDQHVQSWLDSQTAAAA